MTLYDAADYLDVLMLRRAKLQQLVERLRGAHKRLTRRRKYWPLIRPGDTHADEEYTPPRFEERPWQATRYRKGRVDENPKGLWRKAKAPW